MELPRPPGALDEPAMTALSAHVHTTDSTVTIWVSAPVRLLEGGVPYCLALFRYRYFYGMGKGDDNYAPVLLKPSHYFA